MPVFHRLLYLLNLPFGIPDEQLLGQIKNQFREVFGNDVPVDDLKVRVLPRTPSGQWAMIYECEITPKELQLLQMKLFTVSKRDNSGKLETDRDAIWREDSFVEYRENWSSHKPVFTCAELRLLKSSLFGLHYRKVTFVFDQEFLSKVSLKLFNPNTTTLKLSWKGSGIRKSPLEWRSIFEQASYTVGNVEIRNWEETVSVKLGSEVDALQAIRKLNGNREILGGNLEFVPLSGLRNDRQHVRACRSMCRDHQCLGQSGSIINTFDLVKKHGFIPLKEFDPNIGQFDNLNALMETVGPKCIYCNEPYNVIGVLADMSCLCARCSGCSYRTNEEAGETELKPTAQAIWTHERFTRLACKMQQLAAKDSSLKTYVSNLFVTHEPLLLSYKDTREYSKINASLLKQEQQFLKNTLLAEKIKVGEGWWRKIKHLGCLEPKVDIFQVPKKEAEKINTFLNNKQRDEFREDGKEFPQHASVFLLEIKIPYTAFLNVEPGRFWEEESLEYVRIGGNEPFTNTTGKVVLWKPCYEDDRVCSSLHLGIQFVWDNEIDPQEADIQNLAPAENSARFRRALQQLESFANMNETIDIFNCFLGKLRPNLFREELEIPDLNIPWSLSVGVDLTTRSRLAEIVMKRSFMDSSQLKAIEEALDHEISVIDGTAGTGKTSLIPYLALKTLLLCSGKVLILTRWEDQADAVAEAISKIQYESEEFVKMFALRVHSTSTERTLLRGTKAIPTFPCLHLEIRKHDTWKWLDFQLKRKETCIDNQRWNFSSKKQRIIDMHERLIETEILGKSDIIITTINSLNEGRLDFLQGQISTVILDCAENLIEHDTLGTFTLTPRRLVFLGDFSHSVKKTYHFGNKLSGYNRTFGERAALLNLLQKSVGSPEILPITKLKFQHRMDECITNSLSKIYSDGNWSCSEALLKRRRPDYLTDFMIQFPRFERSRVVFVDTGCAPEERVGTKSVNLVELETVISIVERLLLAHVPACRITVLCLTTLQTVLVKRELENRVNVSASDAIKVSSVDGTCIRENDIVIVMTTLKKENDVIMRGKRIDENKLFLACSRAKQALFVLGDIALFKMTESTVFNRFHSEIISAGHTMNRQQLLVNAKV